MGPELILSSYISKTRNHTRNHTRNETKCISKLKKVHNFLLALMKLGKKVCRYCNVMKFLKIVNVGPFCTSFLKTVTC